jgi:uncharacterized protein YcsI (UPF0317 family)
MAILSPAESEITDKRELSGLSTREIRELIRSGRFKGTSMGIGVGYAQATLVAVPERLALDFMIFCNRNPQPCPILEVLDPGTTQVRTLAPGADVRTDMARYRVIRDGKIVAEPNNVLDYWQPDYVGFLIGCSCSFDWVLREAGVPDRGLSTFVTNKDCAPAGAFRSKLWVSVRPVRTDQVALVTQISTRFPAFHGAPIHYGDPSLLGIQTRLSLAENETAVYWACSITPTQAALDSGVDMLVSYPGYMLMTDVLARTMGISA